MIKKRTGIFSFARYDPNFVKFTPNIKENDLQRERIDEKDEETQKLINHRACKTMTHEIIHMFGIRHCIFHECLMNGTNKMEEGDLKPFILCPICNRKLQYAIGFNIKERFENLKNVIETEFPDNNHFEKDLKNINYFLEN